MSSRSIVEQALEQARQSARAAVSDKTASADLSLADEARQVSDALEYMAMKLASDGTPEGDHRTSQITQFIREGKQAMSHGGTPPMSESPTGVQSVAPQSGARTITPSPAANGHPTQSEAPTGEQATIDTMPPKEKKVPTGKTASSLYEVITGKKEAAKLPGDPSDSVALDNQAAPPAGGDNANIGLLRSNEAPVKATKRQAKAPTRVRLKKLFSGASDTGPANAIAKSAFPKAYKGGGGLKEASDDKPNYSASDEHHQRKAGKDKVKQSTRAVGMDRSARSKMRMSGLKDQLEASEKGHSRAKRSATVSGAALGATAGGIGGGMKGGIRGAVAGAIGGGISGAAVNRAGEDSRRKNEQSKLRREMEPGLNKTRISQKLDTSRRQRQETRHTRGSVAARRGEFASSPLFRK